MESQDLYALVYDAVKQAIADSESETDPRILRRFEEGSVQFTDSTGKVVKDILM